MPDEIKKDIAAGGKNPTDRDPELKRQQNNVEYFTAKDIEL
jgi:hypothetical protein